MASNVTSKFQPSIFMATTRTGAEFRCARRGEQLFASNALKRSLSSFALEAQMVTTIIKIPKSDKTSTENSAVDKGGCVQFEHNLR
jgi:hypothetical protein